MFVLCIQKKLLNGLQEYRNGDAPLVSSLVREGVSFLLPTIHSTPSPWLQARFLLFPILCYSGAHPRSLPFHSWANEKKGLIKTLIQ